jgi:hypothetical protein
MAPILSFDTARGVTVAVAGLDDDALVARIAGAAKRSLQHIMGKWQVSIAPTTSRGQWRMALRGTAGIHVWVFAARRESLPEGTGERLAAFLASVSRR